MRVPTGVAIKGAGIGIWLIELFIEGKQDGEGEGPHYGDVHRSQRVQARERTRRRNQARDAAYVRERTVYFITNSPLVSEYALARLGSWWTKASCYFHRCLRSSAGRRGGLPRRLAYLEIISHDGPWFAAAQPAPSPIPGTERSYGAYLTRFSRNMGHNLSGLWRWEHSVPVSRRRVSSVYDAQPWQRTGPGEQKTASRSSIPRFDDCLLARLRERVFAEGKEGILCSSMFFDGWGRLHWVRHLSETRRASVATGQQHSHADLDPPSIVA